MHIFGVNLDSNVIDYYSFLTILVLSEESAPVGVEQLKTDLISTRDRVFDLARTALDEGHPAAYRSLTDLAEKLTRTANSVLQVPSTKEIPTGPSVIPIFSNPRNGNIVEAELHLGRVRDGRGACIQLDNKWLTTSGAAMSITGTNVNGWRNFWKYHRPDGSVGSIAELRGI